MIVWTHSLWVPFACAATSLQKPNRNESVTENLWNNNGNNFENGSPRYIWIVPFFITLNTGYTAAAVYYFSYNKLPQNNDGPSGAFRVDFEA